MYCAKFAVQVSSYLVVSWIALRLAYIRRPNTSKFYAGGELK